MGSWMGGQVGFGAVEVMSFVHYEQLEGSDGAVAMAMPSTLVSASQLSKSGLLAALRVGRARPGRRRPGMSCADRTLRRTYQKEKMKKAYQKMTQPNWIHFRWPKFEYLKQQNNYYFFF